MQEYEVNVNGLDVTMLLDEETAKRLDAKPKGGSKSAAKSVDEPITKARKTVENK